MDKLILASNSPRRKEILEKFKIPFSIKTSPYIEIFTNENPELQVLNLENMLNLSMQLDSKQQRKCMKDEFDYLHVLDLFSSRERNNC